MEEKTDGWVVVTFNHGHTGRAFMIPSTFAPTRTKSISLFIQDSGESWKYWYRKYNYRCARAKSVILAVEKPAV